MAKTRRKQPTDGRKRQIEREEQFEREVQALQAKYTKVTAQPSLEAKAPDAPAVPAQPRDRTPEMAPPSPDELEAIRQEAEKMVAQRAATTPTNFSRQDPLPGQSTKLLPSASCVSANNSTWSISEPSLPVIPFAANASRTRQVNSVSSSMLSIPRSSP